jgi:hypothetical protein
MINKFRTRAVKRRVAYERYKAVLEAAKISPIEALRASFQLVESYKGHHKRHIAIAAHDTIHFLIEEEECLIECLMIQATPPKELPLLIGNLNYESNKAVLEERLKNVR